MAPTGYDPFGSGVFLRGGWGWGWAACGAMSPIISTRRDSRYAFTLIELLISVGIIVLLISMLLPTLRLVRESAGTVNCAGNQRQIMLAVLAYAGVERGRLPFSDCEGSCPPEYGGSWATWIHTASCGQYLGIELKTYNTSDATGNVRVLHCPLDRETPTAYGFGVNSYGLNWQYCPSIQPAVLNTQPWWYWPTGVMNPWWPGLITIGAVPHVADAPIVVDTAGEARWGVDNGLPPLCQPYGAPGTVADWAVPALWPYLQVGRHRRGTNVGFLDGHVRRVANVTIESLAGVVFASPRLP